MGDGRQEGRDGWVVRIYGRRVEGIGGLGSLIGSDGMGWNMRG